MKKSWLKTDYFPPRACGECFSDFFLPPASVREDFPLVVMRAAANGVEADESSVRGRRIQPSPPTTTTTTTTSLALTHAARPSHTVSRRPDAHVTVKRHHMPPGIAPPVKGLLLLSVHSTTMPSSRTTALCKDQSLSAADTLDGKLNIG